MARIKTRSILVEQGVVSSEEALTLPPSPAEEYFPCPLNDDIMFMLKDAASTIRAHYGNHISAIDLDELLTVATDTTEAEDDDVHVVKLRNAAEAVKETYKEILSEEKETVKQNGGLYVMGTNRHESSRIDQQLRGRAGRQGDPGSSRFFLSFEDDMFVIFGGDSLKNILKMFRVSEDMPVEAPQVTEALDKVQNAVEEKYRDIRGEVFKFDDVLNDQRRLIYSRRRDLLFSSTDETLALIKSYNEETVSDIVKAQTDDDGNVDEAKVVEKVSQFFPPVGPVLSAGDLAGRDAESVIAFVNVVIDEIFNAKIAEKSADSLARSANYVTLVTMDNAWSEHLQAMEGLKETVILRQYQNLDPLQEYRSDGFDLFKGLESKMRQNAIFSFWVSLVGNSAAQPA